MKHLIRICFVIVLLQSCMTTAQKRFGYQQMYQKQRAVPDYNKRAGYEGKIFELVGCNAPVTGTLVFEIYNENAEFETIYKLNIVKGDKYKLEMNPDYYYLSVITKGNSFQDDGFAYHPAKFIYFDDYLKQVIELKG